MDKKKIKKTTIVNKKPIEKKKIVNKLIKNKITYDTITNIKKTELLKENLYTYFLDKSRLNKMLNVINKKEGYSLRLLEWFVTNYSKKDNIIYKIKNKDFNVYLSYKAQLKSFQKKYFDPCRRYNKFILKINKQEINTSVGQLNFFRWAIDNKILDYVKNNTAIIKKDMDTSLKNNYNNTTTTISNTNVSSSSDIKKNNISKLRKKRQLLSNPINNTLIKRNSIITISFD